MITYDPRLQQDDERPKICLAISSPMSNKKSETKTFKKKMWPNLAVGQNLVPLVNIKIAGKWMFIPLKMVLVGIDP